jgi:hypothetical protein
MGVLHIAHDRGWSCTEVVHSRLRLRLRRSTSARHTCRARCALSQPSGARAGKFLRLRDRSLIWNFALGALTPPFGHLRCLRRIIPSI